MHFSKRSLQSVFPSAPFFYVAMFESTEKQREQLRLLVRAENNGRSTDNVRPDRGLDRSNSGLAGHFDRSRLEYNHTNILFSMQLPLNASCSIMLERFFSLAFLCCFVLSI